MFLCPCPSREALSDTIESFAEIRAWLWAVLSDHFLDRLISLGDRILRVLLASGCTYFGPARCDHRAGLAGRCAKALVDLLEVESSMVNNVRYLHRCD